MVAAVGMPIWLLVVICAAAAQLVKFIIYSAARKQVSPATLGQTHGLPSVPAVVAACLLVATAARLGWRTPETGFALVFAIIVVHDTIKVRGAAGRQRQVIVHLLQSLDQAGPLRLLMADYLDPRTHHPAHVILGLMFGLLFALAFGVPSG